MFRSTKLFAVVLIVMIFATAAFAFAAGITNIPTTIRAGEGSEPIGGYNVEALDYVMNNETISTVTFTLNATATNVEVSLDGTTFVACTTSNGGTDWSCTTNASVATATELTIVANNQ